MFDKLCRYVKRYYEKKGKCMRGGKWLHILLNID